MSVSPTQNFLKPPPVPEMPTVTLSAGLTARNSSATASVMRYTVLEPSMRTPSAASAVGDHTQSPEASREFLLVGYVTGSETLFPNVKQIHAGGALSFIAKPTPRLQCSRYFGWRHRDPWPADGDALIERLHQVHVQVADGLPGGHAVVDTDVVAHWAELGLKLVLRHVQQREHCLAPKNEATWRGFGGLLKGSLRP